MSIEYIGDGLGGEKKGGEGGGLFHFDRKLAI